MKGITDPAFPPKLFPKGVIIRPPSRAVWRKTAEPTSPGYYDRINGKRYTGAAIRQLSAERGCGASYTHAMRRKYEAMPSPRL